MEIETPNRVCKQSRPTERREVYGCGTIGFCSSLGARGPPSPDRGPPHWPPQIIVHGHSRQVTQEEPANSAPGFRRCSSCIRRAAEEGRPNAVATLNGHDTRPVKRQKKTHRTMCGVSYVAKRGTLCAVAVPGENAARAKDSVALIFCLQRLDQRLVVSSSNSFLVGRGAGDLPEGQPAGGETTPPARNQMQNAPDAAIAMDLLGPLPVFRGSVSQTVVVTDRSSGWGEVTAMKMAEAPDTVKILGEGGRNVDTAARCFIPNPNRQLLAFRRSCRSPQKQWIARTVPSALAPEMETASGKLSANVEEGAVCLGGGTRNRLRKAPSKGGLGPRHDSAGRHRLLSLLPRAWPGSGSPAATVSRRSYARSHFVCVGAKAHAKEEQR